MPRHTPEERNPEEKSHGSSGDFWKKHSIRNKKEQPGNPDSAGQKRLPSKSAKISPEKTKKILRDDEVHGKKLTKKQRGFFGAVAGRGD